MSDVFGDRANEAALSREKDLLGKLLLQPDRISDARGDVDAEHFRRHGHVVLYARFCRMVDDGIPIDLRTVVDACAQHGELADVGGVEYLATLDKGVVPCLDVRGYAREIKLDAVLRRLVAELEATKAHILRDPHAITNGLPRRHVDAFLYLADSVSTQRDDVFLTVDRQVENHRECVAREGTDTVRLGFERLDELTGGGVRPGEVFGVMARPGTGKTIALNNICDFLGHTDQDLWQYVFSIEMPAAQWSDRQMRIALGIGRHKLREQLEAGTLDDGLYRHRFRRQLLSERPGLSVADISSLVGRARQRGVAAERAVVVVDHFGLLGGDRGRSIYERASMNARELKELAKRHNVPVIVAIQVNRDAGGDGSKELGLGAARDSGVIEEAVDYLVAMRQPARETGLSARDVAERRNRVMMKLVKNRHGDLGAEFPLMLDPITLRLCEVAA